MNHAQIDHLLQVTATRSEPHAGASRTRDTAPPFDNHFRQANVVGSSTAPSANSPPPVAAQPSASESTSAATPNLSASHAGSQQRKQDSIQDETPRPASANATPADDSSTSERTEEARETPEDSTEASPEVVALLAAAQSAEQVVTDVEAAAPDRLAVRDKEAGADAKQDRKELAHTAKQSRPVPASDVPTQTMETNEESTNDSGEVVAVAETESTAIGPAAVTEVPAAPEAVVVQASIEVDADKKTRDSRIAHFQHKAPQEFTETADLATSDTESTAPTDVASPATVIDRALDHLNSRGKSEKKSAARSDASTTEIAGPPVERTATPQRTAESAVVPVTANVQLAQSADPAAATTGSATGTKASGESKPGTLSSLSRLDRAASHGPRGAHRLGQADSTPHVDPARFVSRVARAVQTAHERGGPLHLRLSPPELGAMRMELSVNQGTLTATIETDNPSAKQVLLDNLPALRERLAEQNIKVERFDVDVRRDPSGSQQQYYAPQDREHRQRQTPAATSQTNARRPATEPAHNESIQVRRTITNTSINVVA